MSAAQSGGLGPLTWAIDRRTSLRKVQRARQAAALTSPQKPSSRGKQLRASQTPPIPITHGGNRQRPGAQTPPVPATMQPLLTPPMPQPSHPIQHFIGSGPCSEADENDWAMDTVETLVNHFDQLVDDETGLHNCWSSDAPVHGSTVFHNCWSSDVSVPPHTGLRDCWPSDDPGLPVIESAAPLSAGAVPLTEEHQPVMAKDSWPSDGLLAKESAASVSGVVPPAGALQNVSIEEFVTEVSEAQQEATSGVVYENAHMRAIEDALKRSELAVQRSSAVRQAMLAKKRSPQNDASPLAKVDTTLVKEEEVPSTPPSKETLSFLHESEEVSFCNQTLSPQQDYHNFRLQAWMTGGFAGGA